MYVLIICMHSSYLYTPDGVALLSFQGKSMLISYVENEKCTGFLLYVYSYICIVECPLEMGRGAD